MDSRCSAGSSRLLAGRVGGGHPVVSFHNSSPGEPVEDQLGHQAASMVLTLPIRTPAVRQPCQPALRRPSSMCSWSSGRIQAHGCGHEHPNRLANGRSPARAPRALPRCGQAGPERRPASDVFRHSQDGRSVGVGHSASRPMPGSGVQPLQQPVVDSERDLHPVAAIVGPAGACPSVAMHVLSVSTALRLVGQSTSAWPSTAAAA